MKIIFLCAGKGSRLMPLTKDKPKSLVEVNGKPLLEYTLDNVLDLGYDDLIFVVGYRGDQISHHIVKKYLPSKEFKGNVRFINQHKQNGTGVAVYLTKKYMKNDDFIVLSGDTIFEKKDIEKLIKEKNSLLYTTMKDNRNQYGTLNMDGNKVLRINEKQTENKSNKINCGAYHLDGKIYEYIFNTPPNERFNEIIITDSINMMIDDGYDFKRIKIDSLMDITKPRDIDRLENDIK